MRQHNSSHRHLHLTSFIVDATLINGLVGYSVSSHESVSNERSIYKQGRYAGGPTSPLAIVNVIKGLRYRLRLVSISCDPNFVFSIDGRELEVFYMFQ